MAADERSPRVAIAALLKDVSAIHQYGAESWRIDGGPVRLSAIERLRVVEDEISDGNQPHEAVWLIVRKACLELFPEWQQRALAYLGYEYSRGKEGLQAAGSSPTARIRAAAGVVPIDPANFVASVAKGRTYGQQRFRSYPEAISTAVAQALVALDASEELAHSGIGQIESLDDFPVLRKDQRTPYVEDSRKDLEEFGFFERDSTRHYIQLLADGRDVPVTLFAGAGVSFDFGMPLHERLMQRLLEISVAQSRYMHDVPEEQRKVLASRVSEAFAKAYPSASLGSIVRELIRQDAGGDDPSGDQWFREEIRRQLKAGYAPGGFLARGIAAYAFSMAWAKAQVQVITTNYDSLLDRAEGHVRDYFPVSLTSFHFRPVAEASDSTDIPVTHLNGWLDDPEKHPLVIGEGDFFARYGQGLTPDPSHPRWRRANLREAVLESVCIFIGSSLNDPDLLGFLSRSRHRHPRYALVLRPEFEVDHSDDQPQTGGPMQTSSVEDFNHYLARQLVVERLLHLGITPIVVDLQHQVPQFLREVALRIVQQDDYTDYITRAKIWWEYWAPAFGYKPSHGEPGARNRDLQQHWQSEALAKVLKRLQKELETRSGVTFAPGDLLLEVWLRNPHRRELFLWARSDSLWLDSASAHNTRLTTHDSRWSVEEAFHRGYGAYTVFDEDVRGHWRSCWTVPLALYEEPWYHLPIGVVSVLSRRGEDGGLGRAVRLQRSVGDDRAVRDYNELEDMLRDVILRELDPKTTTWPDGPKWSWDSYKSRVLKKKG